MKLPIKFIIIKNKIIIKDNFNIQIEKENISIYVSNNKIDTNNIECINASGVRWPASSQFILAQEFKQINN